MKMMSNGPSRMLSVIGISLIILLVCQPTFSSLVDSAKQPISIEDLLSYTRIRNIRLSPDGKWVAYLAIRPQIAENRYQSTFLLRETKPGTTPIELAKFDTTADQTFDKDTGVLKSFGGQSLWSADSRQLVYAKRVGDKVQLWLRRIDNGVDVKIAGDFPNAEIVRWDDSNSSIEFKVSDEADNSKPSSVSVDPAMRITDDLNLWSAPWYAPPLPARTVRAYRYNIYSRELVEVLHQERKDKTSFTYADAKWPSQPNETKYVMRPVLSPDRKKSVFTGLGAYNNRDIEKAYRDSFVGVTMVGEDTPPKEFLHTPHFISCCQWKADSKEVYAILRNPDESVVMAITVDGGEVRELLKTGYFLFEPSWSAGGTAFVTVRQGSLMPDEQVKVDLISGKTTVLADPNASFAEKELPEVRFMRVRNPLGGGIFGRLVLPNGYVKNKRYPLIFTTYRAGTNFLEGAVGDEYPILPFAAAGFVVFAMDTGISNMVSDSGDLEFTLMRLKRPLDAMEVVRQQLATEGIIDPERSAICGLSYGSDITVYAVATTKLFKAASVSMSGLDPIAHMLNSVDREKVLESHGYPFSDGAGLEQWKRLSIALNAATVVTPFLIQSADSEAMVCLEAFKALRHYNVPVDWYVYRGEGHVKSQPLNKYYVYRRNLDWMKFWLKDEEDPDPSKADQYARWRQMREAQRKKPAAIR